MSVIDPGERGRKLLEQLRKKEITPIQFDQECAYWELEGVGEYAYAQLPTMPPVLEDYYKQKSNPKFRAPEDFWKQLEIVSYEKAVDYVEHKNLLSKWALQELRRRIPTDDFVNQSRIEEMLHTHEVKGVPPVVEKAKEIFEDR
jgi:hypothetical protein